LKIEKEKPAHPSHSGWLKIIGTYQYAGR